MSTNDVPGHRPENRDVLAGGAWAEHDDGSLILVHNVEAGTVVYSVFDVAVDPPVEYRDAMPEAGFKNQFSWRAGASGLANMKWTWHDKTPFPWERVMENFPAGQKHVSATAQMTAAERVAQSLHLRAGGVITRHEARPTEQRPARTIMERLGAAIGELRR